MPDLEFAEYLEPHAVCVVEWAEHAPDFLPEQFLHLQLRYVSATKRAIVLFPDGRAMKRCSSVFRRLHFGDRRNVAA